MNVWILRVAALVYLAATILHLIYLTSQRKTSIKWASWTTWAAFGLHTVGIVARHAEMGHSPITNQFEAMSFLAWAITGVYLLLQLKYHVPSLGAFVSPLSFVFILAAAHMPSKALPQPSVVNSIWVPIHSTLLIMGYAAFALACASGIAFLIQEHQLKAKKLNAMFHRLPNLEVLDDWNQKCLTIGFPLFTVGLVIGALWAIQTGEPAKLIHPRELLALATWLLYAVLLHGRLSVGWGGRKAAIFSIIGFIVVLFTLVGINFFFPSLFPGMKVFHSFSG